MKNNNQTMPEQLFASIHCNTPWTKRQKDRQKYSLMPIEHNNANTDEIEKEVEQNA